MSRGVSFMATQYDDEVARVYEDHTWETAERAAGRLVLTEVDRERLSANGLRPSWVANDNRDHELFRVALQIDRDYQVFVDTPWRGAGPEELARQVCATLARPPHEWQAAWHASQPQLAGPPTIARPDWHQYRW